MNSVQAASQRLFRRNKLQHSLRMCTSLLLLLSPCSCVVQDWCHRHYADKPDKCDHTCEAPLSQNLTGATASKWFAHESARYNQAYAFYTPVFKGCSDRLWLDDCCLHCLCVCLEAVCCQDQMSREQAHSLSWLLSALCTHICGKTNLEITLKPIGRAK